MDMKETAPYPGRYFGVHNQTLLKTLLEVILLIFAIHTLLQSRTWADGFEKISSNSQKRCMHSLPRLSRRSDMMQPGSR